MIIGAGERRAPYFPGILADSDAMSISYPRQSARTRRFSLGVPRAFQIAPDESRVVFLRTRAGDDPVTCLWTLDAATGEEQCVADPAALDVPGEENLPAEERARRERAREQATASSATPPTGP